MLILNQRKQEYNAEPVFYCKHCLSLAIRNETCLPDLNYCSKCGSTDINLTLIEDWEELYKLKYGFNYLNDNYGRERS